MQRVHVCVTWAYPRVHSFVSTSMLAWCDCVCVEKFLLPPVPPTLKVLAKDGSPSNPRGPVEYPPALLQPSPVSACNRACVVGVVVGGWMGGWVHVYAYVYVVGVHAGGAADCHVRPSARFRPGRPTSRNTRLGLN